MACKRHFTNDDGRVDIDDNEIVDIDTLIEAAQSEVGVDGGGSIALGSELASLNQEGSFWACVPCVEGNPGVGFDYSEGTFLRVCKVEEGGATALYNARAAPEERVVEGDFVLEVNGMKGSAYAMMLAVHSQPGIRMLVARPLSFVIEGLDKSSGSLGLDLCCPPRSCSLEVAQVFDKGSVANRNLEVSAEKEQVKSWDRIISVNNKTGTSEELLQALQDAPTLDLEFARPSVTL